MAKHLNTSEFYKRIFGQKVYKISIDAGCTCPNRDGTKGKGGCTFCSLSGSGDFTADRKLSIEAQVEEAKLLVDKKFSRKKDVQKKYIAYFQNFSSTYGNPESLIKKYEAAVNCPGVVGLAVATRPDCLSEEILNYFSKLSDKFFVQFELGFQTASEETGRKINLCYTVQDYKNAVEKIHRANPGIHVVTHIIFGLPGEDSLMMMNSVKAACEAGTDGIKITSLYIVKGTALEKDFYEGKIRALEEDEYLKLLEEALAIIPENIVVHRLTGDPPKKLLIAPEWTANKREVLIQISRLKEL